MTIDSVLRMLYHQLAINPYQTTPEQLIETLGQALGDVEAGRTFYIRLATRKERDEKALVETKTQKEVHPS
jgi:hypothetical protein